MKHATKSPSDKPHDGRAGQHSASPSAAATLIDNRAGTVAQRGLPVAASDGPRGVPQQASLCIALSPRVIAQARRLEGMFGNALQRRSDAAHGADMSGTLAQSEWSSAHQRVIQRKVPLPTPEEKAILDDTTTFLNFSRNLLQNPPGANLAAALSQLEKILLAAQNVAGEARRPGNPAQTLQNYIATNAMGINNANVLARVRNALPNRIFTNAAITFQQVPQLNDHLLPMLTAAWALHNAYLNQRPVIETAPSGENIGFDYAGLNCLGINLGAPPDLMTLNNNAGVVADVSRVKSDEGSRITWRFGDQSTIAVDIPGGGNENYEVSFLPHIHLAAPDGTPLSQTGIGVTHASEPAHILLHWNRVSLTQAIRNIANNALYDLPGHLRTTGHYP